MTLVIIVTWASFVSHLNLAAVGFLQLLVVLGVAIKAGFWHATVVSLLANLCLNYFFTPPIFSFSVPNPQDWVALTVFETTALVVSRLSTQARAQAARATSTHEEMERLYEFSRRLLVLDRQGTPEPGILAVIQQLFRIESGVLFHAVNAKAASTGTDTELDAETRAAFVADKNSQDADTLTYIRVLRLGVRAVGSIGLRGARLTPVTADAIASLTAIALERANSFERETQTEAERQSEQLRTTVLDALAHEYKTPLTVLRTAATGLIEMGGLSSVQLELVTLIDSETERLNTLTTRLLKTSRLDSADVRIRPERIEIDKLLQALTSVAREQPPKRDICLEGRSEGVCIRADRELVSIAIMQFLDNARKYSDPASTIVVRLESLATTVRISVSSAGPPIPAEERERIFERFYRGSGSSHRAAGTGIGLSITKKVAAIHQGRVWVVSNDHSGNTFFLEMPRLSREQ